MLIGHEQFFDYALSDEKAQAIEATCLMKSIILLPNLNRCSEIFINRIQMKAREIAATINAIFPNKLK